MPMAGISIVLCTRWIPELEKVESNGRAQAAVHSASRCCHPLPGTHFSRCISGMKKQLTQLKGVRKICRAQELLSMVKSCLQSSRQEDMSSALAPSCYFCQSQEDNQRVNSQPHVFPPHTKNAVLHPTQGSAVSIPCTDSLKIKTEAQPSFSKSIQSRSSQWVGLSIPNIESRGSGTFSGPLFKIQMSLLPGQRKFYFRWEIEKLLSHKITETDRNQHFPLWPGNHLTSESQLGASLEAVISVGEFPFHLQKEMISASTGWQCRESNHISRSIIFLLSLSEVIADTAFHCLLRSPCITTRERNLGLINKLSCRISIRRQT